MGAADIREFQAAVAKVESARLFRNWKPAVHALSRLAMFDMLPAVKSLNRDQRATIHFNASRMWPTEIVRGAYNRIDFAFTVISLREIADLGLFKDQVNDARTFLGCTHLDDDGNDVQKAIDDAIFNARAKIARGDIREKETKDTCCGHLYVAWFDITERRRAKAGDSLISHLAAAQHYLRARMHVCAAEAGPLQMKALIEGYDEKKRGKDENEMAINKGNPVFPVDFVVREWAYKGVADGIADHARCNAGKSPPLIIPNIDNIESAL